MSESSDKVITLTKDLEKTSLAISRELLECSIIQSLKSRRQNETGEECTDDASCETTGFNLKDQIEKEIKIYTEAKGIEESGSVLTDISTFSDKEKKEEISHKKGKKLKKEKKKHKKKSKQEGKIDKSLTKEKRKQTLLSNMTNNNIDNSKTKNNNADEIKIDKSNSKSSPPDKPEIRDHSKPGDKSSKREHSVSHSPHGKSSKREHSISHSPHGKSSKREHSISHSPHGKSSKREPSISHSPHGKSSKREHSISSKSTKLKSRNYRRRSVTKSSSPEVHSPLPRRSSKTQNSRSRYQRSPKRRNSKVRSKSPLRKYSRSRSPNCYDRHKRKSRSRSRNSRDRKRHGQRSRSSSYGMNAKRSRRSSDSSRSSSGFRYRRHRNRSKSRTPLKSKFNRSDIRRQALEQVVRNLKIVSMDDSCNPTLNIVEISKLQASGISLEEITDICHVVAQEQHHDKEKEKEEFTKATLNSLNGDPSVRHPFQMKSVVDSSQSVSNSTQYPVKALDEKQLTLTFPVSAGVEHRDEEMKNGEMEPLYPKSLAQTVAHTSSMTQAFSGPTLVKSVSSSMKISLTSCPPAAQSNSASSQTLHKTAIVTPTMQPSSQLSLPSKVPQPVPPPPKPIIDKAESPNQTGTSTTLRNFEKAPSNKSPIVDTLDIPLPPGPSTRKSGFCKSGQQCGTSTASGSSNPPSLFITDSSIPSVFPAYSQCGSTPSVRPDPVVHCSYQTAPVPLYCTQYPNRVIYPSFNQPLPDVEDERPHYDTRQIPGLMPEKDPVITLRELDEQPKSWEALLKLHHVKQKLETTPARHKFIPGKFTGKPMLKPMSMEEHNSGYQAWVKKDFFSSAPAVQGGVGLSLLKKMGWKYGEGLGKNNEGSLLPLTLDFKTDRRGLASFGESRSKKSIPIGPVKPRVNQSPAQVIPNTPIDLSSGKHPVSVLMEYCKKCKMSAPTFELVKDDGPPHDKHFIMEVSVNGVRYVPATSTRTKKEAKAVAAQCALEGMGLVLKVALNTNT